VVCSVTVTCSSSQPTLRDEDEEVQRPDVSVGMVNKSAA
jgi:hypothetical protein